MLYKKIKRKISVFIAGVIVFSLLGGVFVALAEDEIVDPIGSEDAVVEESKVTDLNVDKPVHETPTTEENIIKDPVVVEASEEKTTNTDNFPVEELSIVESAYTESETSTTDIPAVEEPATEELADTIPAEEGNAIADDTSAEELTTEHTNKEINKNDGDTTTTEAPIQTETPVDSKKVLVSETVVNTYLVRFYNADDSIFNSVSVNQGEPVPEPETEPKVIEGMKFMYWYKVDKYLAGDERITYDFKLPINGLTYLKAYYRYIEQPQEEVIEQTAEPTEELPTQALEPTEEPAQEEVEETTDTQAEEAIEQTAEPTEELPTQTPEPAEEPTQKEDVEPTDAQVEKAIEQTTEPTEELPTQAPEPTEELAQEESVEPTDAQAEEAIEQTDEPTGELPTQTPEPIEETPQQPTEVPLVEQTLSFVLQVGISLDGAEITDGQFSALITGPGIPDEGVIAVNQADVFAFPPLTFTLEDIGTHSYNIQALIEEPQPGFVYDKTIHQAQLTVSLDEERQLQSVLAESVLIQHVYTSDNNAMVRVYVDVDPMQQLSVGDTVHFTAEAVNCGDNPQFQWQFSMDNIEWQDIAGATEPTFEIMLTPANAAGYWRVGVTIAD